MPDDRICGLNAVQALFARRPESVNRLYYSAAMRDAAGPLCAWLARMRRPYRLLPEEELRQAAGTVHHGGICALAVPRPIPILDPRAPPRHRLMLVLDGIGNPHNLGAIARSAAYFGAGALLLHEVPEQAMPSDAAYRVAEGGLDHLEILRTRALPQALAALTPFYRTAAAVLDPEALPVHLLPRDRPVALVLGNEEYGIHPAVAAACRRKVRIAGSGAVQSLNVAQAAAVLLYALG